MLKQQSRHSILMTVILSFIVSFFTLNCAYAENVEPPTAITTESGKLNINTADAKTLASTMKGIGLRKAEAIVAYRTTYGPFVDILELEDVKGIGRKTVEANAHLIAVQ